MKRGLLIAGGTLGGLGVVMSITPPQFSSSDSMSMAGLGAISTGTESAAPSTAPAASSSATATPTQSATKAATTKPVATKTATTKPAANSNSNNNSNTNNNANSGNTATTNPTPAAAATTAAPAPAPAGVSGTFTGPSVFVQYGNVQVQITVVNGRITDARAVVAPTGKNDRYTNMAVPVLKKQTLAAQSSNIQGASGASYTSYGWFKSLQGALSQAGL